MYDIYNLIIEGEKRYHKKTSLTELDVKHQQLRMMLKLSYELDYFKYHNGKTDRSQTETDRRYLALNSLINEVGAMVGNAKRTATYAYFQNQLKIKGVTL